VLTEEKSNDIGARLEHPPKKSLKRLTQETGVSKCTVRTATKLLTIRPYKTTVILASLAAARFSQQGSFLQLTFFADEVSFHLQGYINTQNNHYWSSQNPYLTNEVALHPVKVGVWCTVSARRIVVPVFF
jgi:hypothetical protein